MRDVTTVIVTILQSDRFRYQWLSRPWKEVAYAECRATGAQLLRYVYTDVRGTKLSLEKQLQLSKVPYDKVWEPARAFPGGSEFHRIRESGVSVIKKLEHPLIGAPSTAQLRETKRDIPTWQVQEDILETLGVAIPKQVLDFVENFFYPRPVEAEMEPVTLSTGE